MECYLGMVMTFAYNWAPMYFAACNGQTMQVSQNSALYSLLGQTFGGNGSTTFCLPNLQGRAPVHFGTASGGTAARAFGAAFGQENTTLAVENLPAHNHALNETTAGQTVTATATAVVNASDAQAAALKPTNNYLAKPYNGSAITYGYNNSKNVTMASDAVQVTVTPTFNKSNLTIGATGSGTAFAQAQPSLALNFCICTAGLYPTRS